MGIQVIRSGTNWTVDVTALGLVNDTGEKDFLVVISKAEQPLADYVKTAATVITYSGAALPANTVIDFYRWGLRDVDQLAYGEVTSQLGMNRRLTQIERVLDDLREVKQFIWSGVDGTAVIAIHVGQADPHNQYRLKSAAIPELAAHVADADPHPIYTTAAELTAALTGYLPTSQKGAINGLASLDGTSKVPAINSRGCSAVYAAATGIWTFTWPDNSTQTIDTPLELVFQSVNYNSATKLVTFTLVGGATTSFSLADLVDLPGVQTNTANPISPPTTGQKLYVRIDTGEMWVSNGGVWVGPYLSFTAAERTKLASVATGATANSTDATLLARDNHTGAQAISTITNLQSTLDGKQPIDSDLTAIAGLSDADGLIRKTSDGNATLQPISGTGALSLAAANEAAGRSAVGWYGSRAVHLPGSAVALAGEAPIDFGISGLFDRSESTLIHLRGGSVTGTISGAGTLSGNLGALCDAEGAVKTVATGCDATTEITLTIDFGANQPNYGRARWMPFVLFRSAIGGITSTFGTIEVHGATEALPTTWVTADAGNWIDTNTAGSNQIAPGLWQAPEQVMRTTGFVYRYVRFTFKNYLPSTTSPGTFWLAQIGFRHVAGRYARQFLLAAGDAAYGPISVRDPSGANITTIGQGTIRINTGATLNWQSSAITVSLTGSATQLLTVAVPGATGIFVRSTNARITGECTGTGANNVTIHNPAALTGTVSIILERYV